jgi:hypothetical protein
MNRPDRNALLRLSTSCLASLLVVVASACVTTKSSTSGVDDGSPWLKPSPQLRSQIEESAKRLPWTHGLDRVDLISWFAKVGEPAYPTLLQMVLDPRKDVAGAALAALGATRDSRLVDALNKLPWPEGQQGTDLALERARTLLRLGDWQMVPLLIGGLRDERLITRALCIQALSESTHERYDFDPRGEPDAREASVKQWEQWWHDHQVDPIQGVKHDAGPKSATPPKGDM